MQALYAISSGGVFGRGLGQSLQKRGFIPEALSGIRPDNDPYSCPNCGSVSTVTGLQNGCPYCGNQYDGTSDDWVLVELKYN